jgi:hypothetical protein
VELPPGDRASLDVVFRPPASVPPSSTLLPFTVRAEDLEYGVTAGRATGLLTVAAPERISAELTNEPAGRGPRRFQLRLSNHSDGPLTLRLEPRLDPPRGQIDVDPTVVDVPSGDTVTAQVQVRPRVRLVGADTSYLVSISCWDAAATDDAAPLATVEDVGTAKPRLGRTTAAVLAATLLALGAAGAVALGGLIDLRERVHPKPARTSAPPAVTVQRPYALIDVFPRREGPDGLPAAEAALARLTAAGMTVRLVDSTTTDAVADGQGGLWVLLQDGFSSVAAARAYCDQYRIVAPKCDVVP